MGNETRQCIHCGEKIEGDVCEFCGFDNDLDMTTYFDREEYEGRE